MNKRNQPLGKPSSLVAQNIVLHEISQISKNDTRFADA